ncbi:hypothetical protein [Paenibacillus sp. FSL K6-1230]|uniref:hypothetical protein n=1 Tax=Paenibacillus sp. FSL K6-1230 TaxID=2921603 RepID=UPI0030F713BF
MSHISRDGLTLKVIEIRTNLESKEENINKYLRKCSKIESKLMQEDISPQELLKLQYKIIHLERRINDTDGSYGRRLIKTFILLVFLYGITVLGLKNVNSDLINSEFINLLLFMTIGAIGAITYILVGMYNKTGNEGYRMVLAILFPVVFICIFNYNTDGILGFQGINFIFFVCGFSTNVFLLFLNKVVDTAKDALGIDKTENQDKSD